MMSCVYFIGCEETGRVKIGFTSMSPEKRLAALQTGSASTLRLIASVDARSRDVEREWHERFARDRIRGEWFRLTDELREAIRLLSGVAFARRAVTRSTLPVEDAIPPYKALAEWIVKNDIDIGYVESKLKLRGERLVDLITRRAAVDGGHSVRIAGLMKLPSNAFEAVFDDWEQLILMDDWDGGYWGAADSSFYVGSPVSHYWIRCDEHRLRSVCLDYSFRSPTPAAESLCRACLKGLARVAPAYVSRVSS